MRFHASFQALFAIFALALAGPVQALERSEVPARYQWDLKDLYVDEAAWVAAKQELVMNLVMDEIERIYARGNVQ